MVFVGGYVLTLGVLIAVCRLKTVCSVLVELLVILLVVCELSERGTNFLFWKIIEVFTAVATESQFYDVQKNFEKPNYDDHYR